MAEIAKSRLELITDLLKVILWPVIIIIVIILFWNPLKEVLSKSDSITIGNLTLKIKNEIPVPSQSVKQVLNKLSDQEIQELLYLGSDTSEYNGYDEGALEEAPINALTDLNLIRLVEPLKGDTTKQYYKVTTLGAESYNFYISLVNALGKQIDNSNK